MKRRTFSQAFMALLAAGAVASPALLAQEEKARPRFENGEFGEPTVKTPTGLGYRILKEGDGAVAEAGKTVSVHYTGYFKNGVTFDSSIPRGEPIEFGLGAHQVIAGWDEGIAGMKVGEERVLFIPSKLAYGSRGAGRSIPPNTDLYFEVKLVGVKS